MLQLLSLHATTRESTLQCIFSIAKPDSYWYYSKEAVLEKFSYSRFFKKSWQDWNLAIYLFGNQSLVLSQCAIEVPWETNMGWERRERETDRERMKKKTNMTGHMIL